jgi:chromosome segregation ATPase
MDEDKLKNARAAWEGGQRFVQQFSGFMQSLDILKDIADIQQVTSEAQGRLEAVRKATEDAKQTHQDRIAALNAEFDAKHDELDRMLKEAQARAASVDTETKAIVDAAHAQGQQIIDDAKDKADRARTEANVALAALADRISASQQQVTALKQELSNLIQERDTRKAELDGVKTELSAVHSSIAKLAAHR